MAQVLSAVRMFANHRPYPAVAADRAWNIRLANDPFERLASLVGDGLWARIGGTQRNLMRLCFHPLGIRPYVVNWTAVAPLLWQRARRVAESIGGPDMREILDALRPLQVHDTLAAVSMIDATLMAR